MNVVQLEVWHLVSLLLAFFGAVWAFGKTLMTQSMRQLDARFDNINKSRTEERIEWTYRFNMMEQSKVAHEREMMQLKADMPINYIRREDHIRFETGVTGKLDGLAGKLDQLTDRISISDRLNSLDHIARELKKG